MATPMLGVTGLSGAVNFFAGGASGWSGFMTSIDALPPQFLPFTFALRELNDDFSPEYAHVRQPAGRYSYPIYKGMGPRVITFKAGFDASYSMPGTYTNPTWEALIPTSTVCPGDSEFAYSYPILAVIANLEKLKMPKTNWGTVGQIFSGVMNAGLLVKPDTCEPAPPLILLSTGVHKYYLGYLAEAKITELKHTTFGMATRIEVACKFLVTPDLVFTTAEDVIRELLIAFSNFV